jgi:hypothetical protein
MPWTFPELYQKSKGKKQNDNAICKKNQPRRQRQGCLYGKQEPDK